MNNNERVWIPEFFTNEIYLVWLLRSDARERIFEMADTELDAQKEFLMWWFSYGRNEYHRTEPASSAQVTIAAEVVQKFPEFDLTRLMWFLYRIQPDVREHFDLDTAEGRSGFCCWYYVSEIPRLGLFDLISDSELEFLGAPALNLENSNGLYLSRLMHFIWRSIPDLQQAISLNTEEEREKYLAWLFLHGLNKYGLYKYLNPAYVALLYQADPKFTHITDTPITRLMWLCWAADGQLRSSCDIQTLEGRASLKKIVDQKLQNDPALKPIWDLLHSRGIQAITRAPGEKSTAKKLLAAGDASFGVNLVGYALGELGIGEDVRMMARSLEAAGIEFCILNRQPGKEIRQMDFSMARYLSRTPRYPITMVCMTAFDTALLWLDRPDLFENTYMIGFWPWELPHWPDEWRYVYDLVDEIWASSRYTHGAFAPKSPVPVMQMPLAVSVEAPETQLRAQFGLPENNFLFLYVFDFMSYPARKNPLACIEAFSRAFPHGEEPANLVLKVSNVQEDSDKWQYIESACRADPRIIVIAKNLDKNLVTGLMWACDAYLSLHRAEGFGRTMAEAMLLGKPVIATGYSGNADFVTPRTGFPVDYDLVAVGDGDYPWGHGQAWAEPDVKIAAKKMREVYDDPSAAQKKGLAARKHILKHYAPDVVGKKVKTRLEELTNLNLNPRSLTR